METKIKIEGDYKVIAGSTEWLKQVIETSKFRFSSTRHNEPCVVWDFYDKKGEEMVKTKGTIVAFIDAQQADSSEWREYNDNCIIIYPSGNGYHQATLFNYLTNNASQYCDKLIKMLADQLIRKVESDKQSLSIKVTVE